MAPARSSRSYATGRTRGPRRPHVAASTPSVQRYGGSSSPVFVTPTPHPSNIHTSNPRRSLVAASHRGARSDGTTPAEVDEDDEITDDSLHEVVMAINVRERGTVGCAYYIARQEKLLCLEDMRLGGAEAVQALKAFIDPTTVLIPYSTDEEIIDLLSPGHESASLEDASENASSLSHQLHFLVAGEFRFQTARDRLASVQDLLTDGPRFSIFAQGDLSEVDENPDAATANKLGADLGLGSSINLDSQMTIGCAGAILGYIQRRRNAAHLPGDEEASMLFRITSIETFTLKDTMLINADGLAALQIIQSESHPNAQNQGPRNSGSKEGLSLFGLFLPLAKTPQGKSLLRRRVMRPSLDLEVIAERHSSISVLLRPDNLAAMDGLVSHLRAVKNMRTAMINLRKGSNGGHMANSRLQGLSRCHWSAIREFLFRALEIKKMLSDIRGGTTMEICSKLASEVDSRALAAIGRLITDLVDFEETPEQQRTIIKAGYDAELDEMKRMYGGMTSLLTHVSEHIASSVPSVYDAQINVIFFPQIGFLIAVRLLPDSGRGVYEGGDEERWEKVFATAEYAYYKSTHVKEMDQQFGDVYGQICDREIEIAQSLSDEVLKSEKLLVTTSDLLGELDFLLALAQGARDYNLHRPRMTTENSLSIKGGRHLLQERTVPVFVANDTFLVGGSGSGPDTVFEADDASRSEPEGPSMLLITGPNFAGKSVYLKQVALITAMAHMGSYVPAEHAIIGLTDKILTRIWTRESVSRVQSAFAIDLQQMCLALKQATRNSLVIIDEFGKGTESMDGAGLAAGVFDHFLHRGADRPKVVAATHHHELFESNLLTPSPYLSLMHMQVLVDDRQVSTSSSVTGDTQDQITYLYTLQPGRTTSSYGTVCAAMNGIPPAVVARAQELIALGARGGDLVAACAQLSSDEVEDLRHAEAVARRFLATEFGADVRAELGRVIDG